MAKAFEKSNINQKINDWNQTALHVAADKNNVPEIERLLSLKADVNSRDAEDWTALHLASNKSRNDSHLGTIKRLLQNGAYVNDRDINGQSPLHHLVDWSNIKTIELLLNSGADINITDKLKKTPLHISCCNCTSEVEVVKMLIEHGSDINSADTYGLTPFHYVSILIYREKLFKYFLKNGGNIDAVDAHGYSPLSYVINSISLTSFVEKKLAFLLKYTGIVNEVYFEGDTLLNRMRALELHECIIEHIAKLQKLDLSIHSSTLKNIADSEEYREYLKKCMEELTVAKSTKLKHCWVTFFNLLVDSKRKLKNYAGNQDLVNAFKNSDCLTKFPIYGASIVKNMEKGIKTRKLFDKSSRALSCCLPIFNPNHLIIKDVLDCSSSKDYDVFVSKLKKIKNN